MRYRLTQQQFKNLTQAVNFWLKVPRDTVKSDLDRWRRTEDGVRVTTSNKPDCGSTACFGGWLPYSSYFSKLGVHPAAAYDAYPVLNATRFTSYEGKDLAEYLFGERELFASKTYWNVDRQLIEELGTNYSDWGLVLMRLAYVLENAELITDPV